MEPLMNSAQEAFARLQERMEAEDASPSSDPSTTPCAPSSPVSDTDPNRLDPVDVQRRRLMLDLPATSDLQAEVDRLATLTGLLRARLSREVGWASFRLELGQARDAIQAERPAACWCLGLGGRTESGLTIFDVEQGTSAAVLVWRDRCPHCAEGRAAETYYQETLRRSIASVTAQRIRRVFGQRSLRDYQDARLETVDVRPENAATWEKLLAWANGASPASESGLLLWGPVGTGKSFAAVALMRRRIELGEYGLFFTETDYLEDVRNTFGDKADSTTEEVQHAARTVPLMVLDDVGGEELTAWGETQIRALLNARMNARLPTLITSNFDPVRLREVREERIVSRVLGLCGRGEHVYEWQGPDRRWEERL